jgi:hypothetical protein
VPSHILRSGREQARYSGHYCRFSPESLFVSLTKDHQFAYICAVLYLGYKFSNLYKQGIYLLTVFAGITIVMIVCTTVMAIVCMNNFNQGLQMYTMPQQKIPEDMNLRHTQYNSYPLQSLRMELD